MLLLQHPNPTCGMFTWKPATILALGQSATVQETAAILEIKVLKLFMPPIKKTGQKSYNVDWEQNSSIKKMILTYEIVFLFALNFVLQCAVSF